MSLNLVGATKIVSQQGSSRTLLHDWTAWEQTSCSSSPAFFYEPLSKLARLSIRGCGIKYQNQPRTLCTLQYYIGRETKYLICLALSHVLVHSEPSQGSRACRRTVVELSLRNYLHLCALAIPSVKEKAVVRRSIASKLV